MKLKTPIISFSDRLFLSVLFLFLLLSVSFIGYQYQREKTYRVEIFDTKLQGINNRVYTFLQTIKSADDIQAYIDRYLVDFPDVKLTVIRNGQRIVFDSFKHAYNQEEYWNDFEIQEAFQRGSGYEIRKDEPNNTTYFFSATLFPNYLVRTAMPYGTMLENSLKTDTRYLIFSFITSMLLISLFYTFTSKLGQAIDRLKQFVQRAEANKDLSFDDDISFATGELGDITQHIIDVYKNLHDTKEALTSEREKLLTHLSISREGLGIFSSENKEVLVNELFMSYCNLISDFNLQRSEDVFLIPAMEEIVKFIERIKDEPVSHKEKRKSISISNNGKSFVVTCIVFNDKSFELSINDVTQTEENFQLKKQITQNVSHELKTPVSSIQGYLETIVTYPELPEEKKMAFIQRCYAQSNRLSRLLQDLAILSRIEDSSDLFEKMDIGINSLVETILDEIELDLEKKGITVHNELKPGIKVKGNHSLLYSIFRNLIDNSMAHAGENVDIYITCYKETADRYYFSYRDTGVGIPQEHLNRLFERFYRVDKGRSRKLGGTGLGLAIVKNAVLVHNGTIVVKSDKNKGIEFVFTIAKESETH